MKKVEILNIKILHNYINLFWEGMVLGANCFFGVIMFIMSI